MKTFLDRRIDGTHEREKPKPDFVAYHIIDKVAAVGHKSVSRQTEVGFDLVTADTEQRSYDMTIARSDAGQPMDAGAAQEVQQEGFDRIATVMGHAHIGSLTLPAQLLKTGITLFTSSHFDTDVSLTGIFEGVEMANMKDNSFIVTQTDAELFVSGRLFPPQMKITVNGFERIAKRAQHKKESHTVGSA